MTRLAARDERERQSIRCCKAVRRPSESDRQRYDRSVMIRTFLLACAFVGCHREPALTGPAPAPAPAQQPAPTRPEDPEVTTLRGFKDRACVCKDKPCVDDVQQDLIAYAYNAKGGTTEPTEADAKAADEIMHAFEKCVVAAGGKL